MKETIYIETTIPSYYYNSRSEAELVVLSQWTRDWWDHQRQEYELVSSSAVVEELRGGKHPGKQEKLALIHQVKLLPYTDEISRIVDVYIARKIMPNDPRGDALHLAYASFYKCDMLLSWNCQHLVNHHKARHIKQVNSLLGLHVPELLTPFELLNKGL
jgi:predicted nucleic acid-binding protein